MTLNRTVKKGALGTAAGALLGLGVAAPVAAEELRLAHFVSPLHVVNHSIIDPLVEGVAEATDGELTIRVYPGGELGGGPADQYIRAVQGVADITWGLQGYTSAQFGKTMITEMPGTIPEGMSGYDLFWNAYDEHLRDEFPGTRPLAVYVSEPSVFIMRDVEVRHPSDVEGLRVRVSGNIQGALAEEMGATPVQMPAGEIYNAMQTGLIDGVITGGSAIADFSLDEVANTYSVGAPLGHIGFFLVMNEERYQGLSEEFQAAIDANSGIELSRSGEEAWNERAAETLDMLRDDPNETVIDLTEEEIEAFAEVLLPVTDRLIEEMGAEDVLAAMQGR